MQKNSLYGTILDLHYNTRILASDQVFGAVAGNYQLDIEKFLFKNLTKHFYFVFLCFIWLCLIFVFILCEFLFLGVVFDFSVKLFDLCKRALYSSVIPK